MSWMLVSDSTCEIHHIDDLAPDTQFATVPLKIRVGDREFVDNAALNVPQMMEVFANFNGPSSTACPSPEEWAEKFLMADQSIALTITHTLSGSYNSAVLGMNLYREKYGKKQIHIIDSESASCGETQIVKKLVELEEQRLSFEEIVKQIEEFRSNVHTYFVLDNLETLRKNGRLTGVKALVASTLNIKPIMAGDKGSIVQRGQSVGMKKALRRMAEIVLEEAGDTKERFLMITHCNAPDRAETMKKLLMEKAEFKGCLIMDTRGVSSMYANDGGVIVTV